MPQGAASVVSSVTSTSRTYGFLASCLRSKMFVSSAAVRSAAAKAASAAAMNSRRPPPWACGSLVLIAGPPSSTAGAVAGAAVAMHALHRVLGGRAAFQDVVHEVPVAVQAVLLQDPRVLRLD